MAYFECNSKQAHTYLTTLACTFYSLEQSQIDEHDIIYPRKEKFILAILGARLIFTTLLYKTESNAVE